MQSRTMKHETALPITPPSTVEKKPQVGDRCDERLKPRKLLSQLKKSVSSRKPRLKYRPVLNSVFDLDAFMDSKLSCTSPNHHMDRDASFIKYALSYSKRMVVVSGAGVSVAAGIPDFRSSEGVFSTENGGSGKDLFDYNRVYGDESMSVKFNRLMVSLFKLSNDCLPTRFHEMLNGFAKDGRLLRLYTQNIDGLDTQLPHLATNVPLAKPIPSTVQLHGSIKHMECNKCLNVKPFDPEIFKCDDGYDSRTEIIPSCPQCEEFETVRRIAGLRSTGVGKLRPRVILYNEIHPEGDFIGEIANNDLKKRPDCLIVVGTSLKIPGVKNICRQFAAKVHANKGIVLYLNTSMPPKNILDSLKFVDLIVLGDCQHITSLL
ncbi:NAD-dependent histone deacetylase HST4 [Saccharomyces eubayanus]|uniref:NAD-dependent histone deacetylase HST4 n=1 Tax=Saccharomyces eubayanus TaxID=1080349 RepID=UPI0006C3D1B3|nr:HST4-like protein [Saccharomyces eubayanus]KOH01034.1 HST4-like protein [Saccharomyces eubayanus]